MKILYTARMVKIVLLQPATPLAREVSSWNRACNNKLPRVVCYTSSKLNVNLVGNVGDPTHKCFTASGFAGDPRTSKSTTLFMFGFGRASNAQWRPQNTPRSATTPQRQTS